jgi:hypothetical protein
MAEAIFGKDTIFKSPKLLAIVQSLVFTIKKAKPKLITIVVRVKKILMEAWRHLLD